MDASEVSLDRSETGVTSPSRRKHRLVVAKDGISQVISFYPESPFTTPESIRQLLRDAFGIPADVSFVLTDDEDDSIVPIDKSLCYLKSVSMKISPDSPRRSSPRSSALKSRPRADSSRLPLFLDLAHRVHSEPKPEPALRILAARSRELLFADSVTIFLVDYDMKCLHAMATSNVSEDIDGSTLHHSRDDDDAATVGGLDRISLEATGNPCIDTFQTGRTFRSDLRICAVITQSNAAKAGVIDVVRFEASFTTNFDDEAVKSLEFVATVATSVVDRLQVLNTATRAEERAQSLLKVTKTLAALKEPEEIVSLLVKEAYRLLTPERVAVFLVHAQERELEICLSKDANGKRIPMTVGVAGYVARTGHTVNVPDARQDPRFDANTDLQTGFRTKSVLCCPINDSMGRVIGVVQTLNKKPSLLETSEFSNEPEAFTKDDQELLELLTQSVGITLQNAQLLHAAEHSKVTTRALLRLVQQIVVESDFIKLDHLLRSCCKQLLDCDRCIVAWVSRADSTLRIFLDDHQTLSISMAENQAAEALLCRSDQLRNVADISSDLSGKRVLYDEKTSYRTQSVLVSPIAGGMEGPIAFILALNKLAPESSLSHASSPSSAASAAASKLDETGSQGQPRLERSSSGTLRRVSRAIQPFSKEDETDLMLFTSEVEGALRVKRNLQMDFTNLLLDEQSFESGKVDAQSRRMMMLYSSSSSKLGSGSSLVSNADKKRKQEMDSPRVLVVKRNSMNSIVDEESLLKRQGSEDTALDLEMETQSKRLVESTLSDMLNLDVLGQSLETCKEWTLALFLSDLPSLKSCGVNISKLPNFVNAVHDNYNLNPFHNFYHAFSVLHVAHDLVKRTVEGRKLDFICALSIQLAALCHDLGHKGMTNSYEAATMSDLAVRYSDDAVLERYHCHLAFKLLYQEEDCNILASLSREDLAVMRRYIVEGILATDMRRHAEHVAELERLVVERRRSLLSRTSSSFLLESDFLRTPTVRSRRNSVEMANAALAAASVVPGSPRNSPSGGTHHRRSSSFFSAVPDTDGKEKRPLSPKALNVSPKAINGVSTGANAIDSFFAKPEGKSFLVQTIVHSADLSSQSLKHEYAEDWGRRITAEFTAQAEMERAKQLPVSVPVSNNDLEFYKSQVFFIRQIALPLWRGVAELIPEASIRVDALIANADTYDGKIKSLASSDSPAVLSGVVASPPPSPLRPDSVSSLPSSTKTPSPKGSVGLQSPASFSSVVEMDVAQVNEVASLHLFDL